MRKKKPSRKRYSADLETWYLLGQAKMLIQRTREKDLNEFGITSNQLGVMYAVKNIGKETTPAKISRYLGLHPNTISSILTKMEKNGLITKNKDLEQKHHIRVLMTEKGEKIFNSTQKPEGIHRIFGFLSDDEEKKLQLQLKMLAQNAVKELELDMQLSKILISHFAKSS